MKNRFEGAAHVQCENAVKELQFRDRVCDESPDLKEMVLFPKLFGVESVGGFARLLVVVLLPK